MQRSNSKSRAIVPRAQSAFVPSRDISAQVFSYITGRPSAGISFKQCTLRIHQSVIVLGWTTTSVTVPTLIAQQFQFADVDQYAALTAVFDQYKINMIECWIEPQGSNSNISNAGRYASVIDLDDVTALASVGSALDYQTCLVSGGQSCQYRKFRPHVAVAAYTGAFGGFKNEPASWIDTSSSTVKHYGLKAVFEPTSSTMAYDLTLKYHISLRQVR